MTNGQQTLIESPKRPVLRWHGGKWMIAKWIIAHFPAHEIYVEPFGGAASVLLKKPRSIAEIYNDLDDDLVNLFRVLRDSAKAERLIAAIYLTPWARTEFFDSYEEISTDDVERARMTIVRCFMGFGTTSRRKNRTGFRGKAVRENSTGPADFCNYPESLKNVVNRLRGVTIENRPAISLIKNQDSEETLFYIDPPYPPGTRSALRYKGDSCYAHEMNDADHRKLASLLRMVKGMVVISGYRCDLYDSELFPDWESVEKPTNVDGGKKRVEVLWLNPAAAARMKLAK